MSVMRLFSFSAGYDHAHLMAMDSLVIPGWRVK
jgi:hypothetical protein